MRYSIVTLIAAALMSTFALAASTDQLAATKHNFTASTSSYNALLGVGNTMCQPCHTPHHALVEADPAHPTVSSRLWNHALSTTAYTLYEGGTGAYDDNNDGSQGMDRVSRLCLGCHDGTVALDSFGMGPTGTPAGHVGTTPFASTDVANLGTDFRDDHPVGVDGIFLNSDGTAVSSYLKAATITYVDPLATPLVVKSAKVAVPNTTSFLNLAMMTDGRAVVGCKTCHNPHGSGSTALTPYAHLLYVSPENLCNTCHYK